MSDETATIDRGAAAGPGRIDDRVLVDRLRAGDEAAFTSLVESLTPSLLRLARLNGPEATAEEAVQETWLAVIAGLDGFAGRSSIRSWIGGILVNVARTKARRERRHVPSSSLVRDDDAGTERAVPAGRFRPADDEWAGHWISYPRRWDELPDEAWLSKEAEIEIHRAIRALPPVQREVVTLRDVLGWSAAEVVEAVGLSPGNQRVLLHRGRSRVRAALEGFAERATVVGAERARSSR